MSSIYLATCPNSWTHEALEAGKLGGTQQLFMHLRNWFMAAGYDVYDPLLNPPPLSNFKADIAIHDNVFQFYSPARKHILFAGSWHATAKDPRVDVVVFVSEYTRERLEGNGPVIPAPWGSDLVRYKGQNDMYPFRLVCTANPNRHFQHTLELAKILTNMGEFFDIALCGGNKLYSNQFPELHRFEGVHRSIIYRGILPRHDVIGLLTSAHLWVYPCFTDDSETFCVSMLEAAALDIPVILPRRRPFTDVLPDAIFCDTVEEIACEVVKGMESRERRSYENLERYSEESIAKQYLALVEGLLK